MFKARPADGQMSVAQLLDELKTARRGLSPRNPLARVLEASEAAVTALAIENHRLRTGPSVTRPSWWTRLKLQLALWRTARG